MRRVSILLVAAATLIPACPALAADQLRFGPPTAWVVPQTIPAAPTKGNDQPVAFLLHDQQTLLEPGKISSYSEIAFKIQKPEGLQAGNLSLTWNPATDTVTVHRVQIRRGEKVIDVLAAGQTFTTMRRESNLELATIDGLLTANIQPEGLQEGDVVVLAATDEHSDPTLKGHVEAVFAPWASAQIALAHARLAWPSAVDLKVKAVGDLAAPRQGSQGGRKTFELTMHDIQPVIEPANAPVRFKVGRMGEATDFRSWSDAAALMVPLYRDAASIPASGPLRVEVEKIRAASTDPTMRAEQALQLVEQRVRYVALLMGLGGYVPASAEITWSRRFGDCKGKTALLLGILHELGIEAEPVLVNSKDGDAIIDRLPMISLFDHVLIRSRIAGHDYWLDGTRTGDSKLANMDTPNFGWGLPLVHNAQLVRIIPPVASKPQIDTTISIDASAGAYAPAQVEINLLYRGDSALAFNEIYAQLAANQRDEALKAVAKKYFESMDVSSATLQFNQQASELRISARGTSKLEWKDGWFYVPASSIAYDPAFDRAPGPNQQVPFSTDYPLFETAHISVRMPPDLLMRQKLPPAVQETVAGVEYSRTATIKGDQLTVESSQRTVLPEIAYTDALASKGRLKALNKDDVYLKLPDGLRATDADVKTLSQDKPASPQAYLDRGLAYLSRNQFDEAIADFSAGLAEDPKDEWLLGNRAMAYVSKKDFVAAEKDLASVEKLDPNNVMISRSRALEAELKGDLKAAISLYSFDIAKDPSDGFSLGHRALVYARADEPERALADAAEALKITPTWTQLRLLRATLLQDQGKLEEAIHEADLLVATSSSSADALITAAKVYAAGGLRDKAAATLSRTNALGWTSGDLFAQRAEVLHMLLKDNDALKDTEEAIKLGDKSTDIRLLRANILFHSDRDLVTPEIEAMIRDNPTSDYAFVAAGKIYAALGETDKAMQAFDRALAIKPQAYVYLNRAQVRPSSDIANRLADLDAALKLEPDQPDTLAQKARVLAKAERYSEALHILDKIKPDDTNSYAALQRAVVLYKAGRAAEARKLFDSIRSTSKTASQLNSLCWTKATAGIMLDSALKDCQDAVAMSPESGQFLDSLGMAYLRLGKLNEALATYNQAIAMGNGAASLMGRAMVYAQKGDGAHAKADAAAARRLSKTIDETFADYGLKF